MAQTRIKWNEGAGAIVAVYGGDGPGGLTLSSSEVNEGADRQQTISVRSQDGTVTQHVTVRQSGRRTGFITAGGGAYSCAGDGAMLVIKS